MKMLEQAKRTLVSEQQYPAMRACWFGLAVLLIACLSHVLLAALLQGPLARTHLIVGVCSDELTLANKGKTVMNHETRVEVRDATRRETSRTLPAWTDIDFVLLFM